MSKFLKIGLSILIPVTLAAVMAASYLVGYNNGYADGAPTQQQLVVIRKALVLAAGLEGFAQSCREHPGGLIATGIVIDGQPIGLVCITDPAAPQNPDSPEGDPAQPRTLPNSLTQNDPLRTNQRD